MANKDMQFDENDQPVKGAAGDSAAVNADTSNGIDPKALTAALMSAEPDVEMPGRGHAGSVVSNLISLSVGECYTKSTEIDRNTTVAEVQEQLNDTKQKMRQSINQSVRHAQRYDGRKLSMETAQIFVSSGRLFVSVIVTRTA